MPQAPQSLRDEFEDDTNACLALKDNFNERHGVFRKKDPSYAPTGREMNALNYMILEWDYGYEG